jgi:sodium-dependent dicarboxylate transporter 2/3/5
VLPAPPSPVPNEPIQEGRAPGFRVVKLASGAAAGALVLALPLPSLTLEAHRLAAIFACAVVYWITEALPLGLTALLTAALTIVLGVAPARTLLAPYADPVIFVFLGSFVLAESMRTTGLDRRLGGALLARRWATRTPGRLLAAVGAIACGISLWVSTRRPRR